MGQLAVGTGFGLGKEMSVEGKAFVAILFLFVIVAWDACFEHDRSGAPLKQPNLSHKLCEENQYGESFMSVLKDKYVHK